MIFKMNHMFWEENEQGGYRHVLVEYSDRVLMVVVSHRTDGVWRSSVVPMGFTFNQSEIESFARMFAVLPELMAFLCTDEIKIEEIQHFLLTIQEKVDSI